MRLLLLLFALSVSAQDVDPLVAIADADPLELASATSRLGDDAVLGRLGHRQIAVRLAAIRACRFLHAPERALPLLAPIAAGRDPFLAEPAMLAIVRIATSLRIDDLLRREADLASIHDVTTAIAAIDADASARADFRRASQIAAAALRSVVE